MGASTRIQSSRRSEDCSQHWWWCRHPLISSRMHPWLTFSLESEIFVHQGSILLIVSGIKRGPWSLWLSIWHYSSHFIQKPSLNNTTPERRRSMPQRNRQGRKGQRKHHPTWSSHLTNFWQYTPPATLGMKRRNWRNSTVFIARLLSTYRRRALVFRIRSTGTPLFRTNFNALIAVISILCALRSTVM